MKVTRQPKNPGPAAWAKILPKAAHHPTLEDERHVDFLIIGAGFAGLTAARRISELEPTATVAVVDAFRLAEGPAGRNSGFMIDLPHDLASDDYGGQAARDLLSEYEEPKLDEAVNEQLLDYIARREREIPASDALNQDY